MKARFRRLLLVFAAIGLGASGYSLYIHHQLLHQAGYVSACDINAVFSCSDAYLSPYGSFLGVSVALFGTLWFAFVLLLVGAGGRPGSPFADSAGAYVFAMSTLALAAILYLGYAAFFVLRALCIFCLSTYVAVIGLFVVSGISTAIPMTKLPGRALRDLKSLIARPAALATLAGFVVVALGAILLSPRVTGVAAAAVAPAPTQSQQEDFVAWFDAQPRLTLPVSDGGAKVLLVKFTEFQCPYCASAHLAESPVLDRLQAEFPGLFRVVIKHFPLETECNVLSNDVHIASCEAAAAVVMAKAQGRDKAMADWLARNQMLLSPAVVKEGARTTGLVVDFDAQYPRALEQVKTDAGLGRLLGVSSVPTYFLDGVKIVGVLPPPLLELAIRHELSKAGVRK